MTRIAIRERDSRFVALWFMKLSHYDNSFFIASSIRFYRTNLGMDTIDSLPVIGQNWVSFNKISLSSLNMRVLFD